MFRFIGIKEQLLITFIIAAPFLAFSFPRNWHMIGTPPQAGENIFRAKCADCHGLDGAGHTANGKKLKVPDLRSDQVQNLHDDELIEVVMNGKGDMPAIGKKFSPDQAQQVISHVRSLSKKK